MCGRGTQDEIIVVAGMLLEVIPGNMWQYMGPASLHSAHTDFLGHSPGPAQGQSDRPMRYSEDPLDAGLVFELMEC